MLKYIVGNWKMNGSEAHAHAFAATLSQRLSSIKTEHQIILCPPFPYLGSLKQKEELFAVGGQDCSAFSQGPYTGEISAGMLHERGCRFVLVGHSERRRHHHETNAMVKKKGEAALQAGLRIIICVGEMQAQRDAQEAEGFVAQQALESLPNAATPDNTLIAYEPVWAIGTGLTPTLTQIQEMHAHLQTTFKGQLFPVLYGGSVTPQNARQILALPTVSGVLVGSASFDVDDFWKIIQGA